VNVAFGVYGSALIKNHSNCLLFMPLLLGLPILVRLSIVRLLALVLVPTRVLSCPRGMPLLHVRPVSDVSGLLMILRMFCLVRRHERLPTIVHLHTILR
jgi:hypothetical protein